MLEWGDLYTARQKLWLATLSLIVSNAQPALLCPLLACAVSRQADFGSSISRGANHTSWMAPVRHRPEW